MTASDDRRFMAAALRLARWNTGRTSTNPSVACLIVRDGLIVGSGITAPGGRPHAEPQALAGAGDAARGATAYVTLEPCSHFGKTPPCVNALIAAGIARVVIAVTDPDERVSGRGIAMLREAGIAVDTGLLENEGRAVLAGYLTRQVQKRPQVILKLAVSADGMIGRRDHGQVAITGPIARAQVHALRAEVDAILIGIGTARADDPELTCRLPGLHEASPRRFVLDRRLEISLGSKLVRSAREVAVTVVGDDAGRRAALEAAGVEVWGVEGISPHVPVAKNPLHLLLHRMATSGISSLMVEGGAGIAAAFLEAGVVDRILLLEGPDKIGGDGVASPVTRGHMPSGFRLERAETFGPDRAFHYERESGCLPG